MKCPKVTRILSRRKRNTAPLYNSTLLRS